MTNVTKIFKLFKDKKFRRIFLILAAILLLVTGSLYYLKKEGKVFIDNSFIAAPIISITSLVPGNLNEVDVAENQNVKNGDLLAVVGTQSLRAQTDGIIIQTNKQIGSLVTAQTNVIQMINPDDFRIVGTIDENKGLKDLRVGQVASFTIDAFPGQTFWGWVDEISGTAKQTQAAFSISNERPTQQFGVFVRFDVSKYSQIKNGMSAKLTVFTKTN